MSEDSRPVNSVEHIQKPDIFSFQDFRAFIREFVTYKKTRNPNYTFSMFARRLGLSKSMLHRILEGTRRLPEERIAPMAEACELVSRERNYLAAMVAFNQCDEGANKSTFLEKLLTCAPKDDQHYLSDEEKPLIRHWFVFALLEYLRIGRGIETIDSLLPRFQGAVTRDELESAVAQLAHVGYITMTDAGMTLSRNEIVFVRQASPELIRDFHRQNIPHAIPTLESTEPSKRDFNSTALAITYDDVALVKSKVHELLEFVMELSSKAEKPDAVYQFNCQLFPLLDLKKKDGE